MNKKYFILIGIIIVLLVFSWVFIYSKGNYEDIVKNLNIEISQLKQDKENLKIIQQLTEENGLTKDDMDISSVLLRKLFPAGTNISFKESIRIITHDGYISPVPHTLEAMQKAVDLGVYGIEDDVQFTKDHVPVLLDNPDINGRKISEITSAELKHYKINGLYNIPELGEAIDFLKGKVKVFIIDLTGVPYLPDGMKVEDIPIVAQKAISEHKGEDFVVIQTANEKFLDLIDFDKYMVAWNTFSIQKAFRDKIDFYTLNPSIDVTAEIVKAVRDAGADVIPVNVSYASREEENKIYAETIVTGAKYIMVDYVEDFLKFAKGNNIPVYGQK